MSNVSEPTATPGGAAGGGRRAVTAGLGHVRPFLSVALSVVAVIGVLASVVSVWAHEVVFDPRRTGDAVDRALQQPEVIDAVAQYLTDQVFRAVAVDDRIAERLPPSLEGLAPVMAGGVRAVVHDQLVDVVSRDDVRGLVVAAAERSHRAVLDLLDRGSLVDGVIVDDDEIRLNLLPLLGRGLAAVQSTGLIAGVDLPELTAAGDPEEQIQALSTALGRPLPDDLAQVVVYRGDKVSRASLTVARAQQALVLAKRAIVATVMITLLSAVAAVALARQRRRAVVLLVAAMVVTLALARAAVVQVTREVPTLVATPGARVALTTIVGTIAGGLLAAVSVVILLGAALAVLAVLSGWLPGRGLAARTWLAANGRVAAWGGGGLALAVLAVAGWGTVSVTFAMLAGLGAVGSWWLGRGARPGGVS